MDNSIKVLAKYLTENGRVVKHSVGLQLKGPALLEATEFYALREALGVSGYMKTKEAEDAIVHTLTMALEVRRG